MVRIKVCGITRIEDAMAAAELGADALGFIFAESPRRVNMTEAKEIIDQLPPFVSTVGVFVNAAVDEVCRVRDFCGLDAVQVHGQINDDDMDRIGGRVIRVIRVAPDDELDHRVYPGATILLDTFSKKAAGGTGQTFDWNKAVELAKNRTVILAGGLNPDNVARAVETVKPYAVDVSSGVESEIRRKDHEKLASFIKNAGKSA